MEPRPKQATPPTAATITQNARNWRRVSVSIDSFRSTISCAMSSVISSSFTSSESRMRFASSLICSFVMADASVCVLRFSHVRAVYGRSSATISISCTRKHAAPGSRRTTGGLYSRASTRGKARFRLTIELLSSLYYWQLKVVSYFNSIRAARCYQHRAVSLWFCPRRKSGYHS